MTAYYAYSDLELTALLKGGDVRAFDELYHRYAEPLYKFAFRYYGRKMSAGM